jgi:outer membrane protein assembly factor BamB
MPRHLLLAAFAATGCLCSAQADWAFYRGPTQNGIAADNLPLALGNMRQLWKTEVGTGTSSIVVANQHAFTMGNVRNKDIVYCLDATSGRAVWKHEYPLAPDPRMFEGGPAATLVLADGKLVILSELGELIIGEANPVGFKAAYREQVLGKRCWVQPTVANGRIFCRNNNGSLVAIGQ